MEISVKLSKKELQLIYAACMSYGERLSDMMKMIPNEWELQDSLSDRAKESYVLAQKVIEYTMEE